MFPAPVSSCLSIVPQNAPQATPPTSLTLHPRPPTIISVFLPPRNPISVSMHHHYPISHSLLALELAPRVLCSSPKADPPYRDQNLPIVRYLRHQEGQAGSRPLAFPRALWALRPNLLAQQHHDSPVLHLCKSRERQVPSDRTRGTILDWVNMIPLKKIMKQLQAAEACVPATIPCRASKVDDRDHDQLQTMSMRFSD